MPKADPKAWRELLAKLGSASAYDGLRGTPPAWVPAFKRQDFDSARGRAATFLILQPAIMTVDSFAQVIQRAGRRDRQESDVMELLFQRHHEGWALDAWSLLTLVAVYHAAQLGKAAGLRHLTDSETGDRLSGEWFKAHMRDLAKRPRSSRRALPDEDLRAIADQLLEAGAKPHNLQSMVRAKLEKEGRTPPSPPALRDQLARLGYRKKKES